MPLLRRGRCAVLPNVSRCHNSLRFVRGIARGGTPDGKTALVRLDWPSAHRIGRSVSIGRQCPVIVVLEPRSRELAACGRKSIYFHRRDPNRKDVRVKTHIQAGPRTSHPSSPTRTFFDRHERQKFYCPITAAVGTIYRNRLLRTLRMADGLRSVAAVHRHGSIPIVATESQSTPDRTTRARFGSER